MPEPKRYSLAKKFIDNLSSPGVYRDKEVKGFAVKVTESGSKIYMVNAKNRESNRTVTVTIGRHNDPWTVQNAREQARKIKLELSEGVVRTEKRREVRKNRAEMEIRQQWEDITLGQVLDDYCQLRDTLKESTIQGYRRVIERCAGEWLKLPIREITPEMVLDLYQSLSNIDRSDLDEANRRKSWDGKAQAAQLMRVLRALFNFAEERYEHNGKSLITINPVKKLGKINKGWNKVVRRDSVIQPHQFKEWYQALGKVTNPTIKDYLLLLMFTGLRKDEAATLRWANVHLNGKPPTLTVTDTKNGTKHTIPLSSYVHELLKARRKQAGNEFVFPGKGNIGHIVEIRKQTKKMVLELDHYFMCHDLRRTFTSVAERVNLGEYTKKRLLNHKTTSDVTHGYIHLTVDDLVQPMQEISDFMEENMGLKKNSATRGSKKKVIEMNKRSASS